MLLCGPPRNWFYLKCSAQCVQKSTSWRVARLHPHSHSTPILTRHQLDHFQEIWHFVSLFFTLGTLQRKSLVDQLSMQWRGVKEGCSKIGKKVMRWQKEVSCRRRRSVEKQEERKASKGKYLIRSCVRLLKESVAELLTLASGEATHVFMSCPDSEVCGQRDPRTVAMVCSRPVVKPSKTCLFTLRPKMDLSSSGTYSCKKRRKKRMFTERSLTVHGAINVPIIFDKPDADRLH